MVCVAANTTIRITVSDTGKMTGIETKYAKQLATLMINGPIGFDSTRLEQRCNLASLAKSGGSDGCDIHVEEMENGDIEFNEFVFSRYPSTPPVPLPIERRVTLAPTENGLRLTSLYAISYSEFSGVVGDGGQWVIENHVNHHHANYLLKQAYKALGSIGVDIKKIAADVEEVTIGKNPLPAMKEGENYSVTLTGDVKKEDQAIVIDIALTDEQKNILRQRCQERIVSSFKCQNRQSSATAETSEARVRQMATALGVEGRPLEAALSKHAVIGR